MAIKYFSIMGDDSESSNFKVSHIILFYSLNIHLFIKTEIEFQVFAILQKSSNSNCDKKFTSRAG